MTVIVRLSDLLSDLRDAIDAARTPSGWDKGQLEQAIRRSFDFLAPYTVARVETLAPDGGDTARSAAARSD